MANRRDIHQNVKKMNVIDKVLFLSNNVDPLVCKNMAYYVFEACKIIDARTIN